MVETPPPMRTSSPAAESFARLSSYLDPIANKVKGRAALHYERLACVVGFHESPFHGPCIGANMLRPSIQAPTFSNERAAISLSTPRFRCSVLASS